MLLPFDLEILALLTMPNIVMTFTMLAIHLNKPSAD